MNARQEQLKEQFDRDVDILRGVGGIVTTDDLRAHGEAMAWAAVGELSSHPMYDEAELLDMRIDDNLEHLAYFFADRHADPESRANAREAIGYIRKDRAALKAVS